MQYPGSTHVLDHVEAPRRSSLGQESPVFKGLRLESLHLPPFSPHMALMTCFPECLVPGPSRLPDLAVQPRLSPTPKMKGTVSKH